MIGDRKRDKNGDNNLSQKKEIVKEERASGLASKLYPYLIQLGDTRGTHGMAFGFESPLLSGA
jgi:hypothetical protein